MNEGWNRSGPMSRGRELTNDSPIPSAWKLALEVFEVQVSSAMHSVGSGSGDASRNRCDDGEKLGRGPSRSRVELDADISSPLFAWSGGDLEDGCHAADRRSLEMCCCRKTSINSKPTIHVPAIFNIPLLPEFPPRTKSNQMSHSRSTSWAGHAAGCKRYLNNHRQSHWKMCFKITTV